VLRPLLPAHQRARRGDSAVRAVARRGQRRQKSSRHLDELWVPHRSELLRIAVSEVHQIDAERDYVRLHVGGEDAPRSYLLLQTIAGLEAPLALQGKPGQQVLLGDQGVFRGEAEQGSQAGQQACYKTRGPRCSALSAPGVSHNYRK